MAKGRAAAQGAAARAALAVWLAAGAVASDCGGTRVNASQTCDAALSRPPSLLQHRSRLHQAGAELPPVNKRIEVRGRQLLVYGKPVHLKGVAWNPVPKGGTHPADLNFARVVDRDVELMEKAGLNAVRTYEPIDDLAVLDKLWAHGIWVLNSVYNFGGLPPESVIEKVNRVKRHPAILMWTIGNEWNYNGLYKGMGLWDAAGRLQEVARLIKAHDVEHPLACIYGELTDLHQVDLHMSEVDVWGVNSYRGVSFGALFDTYAALTTKPLFLGEYGADAFNAKIGREDQASQAQATVALTVEIALHSSVTGGVCIGGFIFELCDEWWKDQGGSTLMHDIGGIAPGGGPFPDQTFNEEWWGIADIDGTPRVALEALASVGIPDVADA